MQTSLILSLGAILAPAFLAGLAGARAPAAPQTLPAASTAVPVHGLDAVPASIAHDARWTGVLHDQPGDGRSWAMGATWKASFGADGAVYFPRVGAAERTRSLALSPDLVTLGGEPLALASDAQPLRRADRIEFDRGSFTERYDLSEIEVEQSFVFESLPRAGDLVLRIPFGADLGGVASGAGLEFHSERGRVTYSRAIAVDARGRRTEVATHVEDGAITIRVGADVLADAALPLVVDPVLSAVFPDTTTDDTLEVDTAFDPFNGVWVVSYELVFSATDHDVIAKEYTGTGGLIATASIDITTDSWVRPRIADNAFAHKFLVVAGATAASNGSKTIRGRIAQPNGTLLTLDPQISVSGAVAGACTEPDVGGHSSQTAPGSWGVVWARELTSSDRSIMYCLISSAGTHTVTPQILPVVAGMGDDRPSISKTNGGTAWTIAFERFSFSTQTQIIGARLSAAGQLIAAPFFIGGGINVLSFDPIASSPIDGTDKTLVVWQIGLPALTTSTTIVALLDGATVLQVVDLRTLDTSTIAGRDHVNPSVDSDGSHFLVSYSEFNSQFGYYELFATDLALSANALQAVQMHMELQPGLGLSQLRSNVAAARTTGALARRYLVAYDYRQNDQDHDAAARFVEGVLGGPTVPSCFGDGTAGACPCGNSGGAGRGCANSVFAAGAAITLSSGQASTLVDTAVLQLAGVPPGAGCVFFQGDAVGAPIFLGDGLFCAGGSVQRVGTRVANPAGALTHPQPGEPTLSVRGGVPLAGGTRVYQATYRNAASFCTSATFNVSSGLTVHWAR